MAEDWLADVKKYVANVDEAAVAGIVRHCGIALRNRDSSLVSFSDTAETDRVRESFLKKKLELTDPDETLDAAIADVGERMKADRTKNRVTVYYLLAEHFGKLGLFGGSTTATGGAPVAEAPAAGIDPVAAGAAGVAGLAALGGAAAAGTATAGTAAAGGAADAVAAHTPHASADAHHGDHDAHGFADVPEEGGSILGRWWLWVLLLIALVLLFLLLKSCHSEPVAVVDNSSSVASYDASGDNMMDGNLTAPAPAIPTGAGIVSEMRGDHPALIVYFDTGKADVSPDFATKAADLKAYIAGHPDTKLAVSGYNDPTGNAAVNAELSKNRAKAVAAALKAEGVPEDAVVLEKPADTTIASTDNAAARRVEVTIK